jgi:hypothetical protein
MGRFALTRIGSPRFAEGGVDTGFLGRWLAAGKGDGDVVESAGTVRDQDGVDLD